jgi:hypothetical protein
MKYRHATLLPITFGLFMLALAALACNLSDNAAPATLVLRATATPPPTIGYATLPPEALPQQPDATTAPRSEAAAISLINQVQTDRLMLHVATLVEMGTRHVNSPYNTPGRGIGGARDYIINEFNTIADASRGNFRVLRQDFPVSFAGVGSTATNVIGIMQGNEIGAGVIIVGAHYDSITIATEDGNAFAPGANDNATGVAAMLEIARILSQRPHRSTIIFVAFSAEEIGRNGSQAFVNEYVRINNLDVRAMINMDIIGSNTGANGAIDPASVRLFSAEPNNSPSRLLARGMGLLAELYLPVNVIVENTVDRAGRFSDHMSFSEAGYPAVRFIEALEEPERQHTNRDTLDDIQPAYLTQNTQMFVLLVTSLADGPRPPVSIVLRDEGNGLRTLLWDPVPEAAAYIIAFRPPGAARYSDSVRWTDVATRSITWDRFTPDNFEAITIAVENSAGIIGPFSFEYIITR